MSAGSYGQAEWRHHSSRARGLAGHAPARGSAWTAALSPAPAGASHARSSCRCQASCRDAPHSRLRSGSRELPQVTIGRRLARADNRRYQSGEVDYDGHISRRGDTHLRGLLYEAATVILTRTSAESALRTWGLRLRDKIGFKRAAVAVARKLAVVMHAMLRCGQLFDRTAGGAA